MTRAISALLNFYNKHVVGERNGTWHLFCSWRSLPKISAPPKHSLRLVNKPLLCVPWTLLKPLLVFCILVRLFVMLLFKAIKRFFRRNSPC